MNRILSNRKYLNISLLIFILFEAIVCRQLVRTKLVEENNDIYSAVILFINTFIVFLLVISNIDDKIVVIILMLSYFLRLITNIYNVVNIPLRSDMLRYHNSAVNFFYENSTRMNSSSFSMATVIMGIVYKLYGVQRIILQHFNGTLVVISGVILYNILKSLNLKGSRYYLPQLWVQFSYYLYGNSNTIHRESMIVFSISCSLYFFVKWFLSGRNAMMMLSLIFSLIASSLHAGSIGLLLGYIIGFILYRPKEEMFEFSARTILMSLFFILFFIVLYFGAFDIFLYKFTGRSIERMIGFAGDEKGGSAYTIGGNITSNWQLLPFTPLRTLYLFCSPMPWDWRGLQDILAFIGSSIIYGYCFVIAFRATRIKGDRDNKLIFLLLISLLTFGVIFGWGTRNAGTALRHRDKVITVAALVMCLSNEQIRKKRNTRITLINDK